jgi:hypothetical protein
MKKPHATWRPSFSAPPEPEQLDAARALLAPILRIGQPAGHALILQEYGVSDRLFTGPEVEPTAGEIVLFRLIPSPRFPKRLDVGWVVSTEGTMQNLRRIPCTGERLSRVEFRKIP